MFALIVFLFDYFVLIVTKIKNGVDAYFFAQDYVNFNKYKIA